MYFIKSGLSPVEHLAWILLYTMVHEEYNRSREVPRTSKNNVQQSGSRTVSNTKLSRGPVCLVAREIKESTVHFATDSTKDPDKVPYPTATEPPNTTTIPHEL